MPVAVALNVKDRSAAFMVALVFAGGSTVDSCAGCADVPCTYGLRLTVVSVFGVVCLTTASMVAGSVFAGRIEKYTSPVPVFCPSETVTCTPTRPEVAEPVLNTSCPSARVETTTWSLFCGTADTNVIGSPSGSWKLPSAFAVYVARCSTSYSGGVSACLGA